MFVAGVGVKDIFPIEWPPFPSLHCPVHPEVHRITTLQKRGIKMNPVSTLYHIAPCCFVFLFLPFTYIELPKIINDPNVRIDVPLLLGSAAIAFGEGEQMGSRIALTDCVGFDTCG